MNSPIRPETKLRDRLGRARAVAAAQAGFTLVEMLVVLAIIGLLVGLVAPRVFGQLAEAKVRTAHIQIESFKNALDLFYLDAGRYPTTQEGLQALNTRPANLQELGRTLRQGDQRAPRSLEQSLHLPGAGTERQTVRHHLQWSGRQERRRRSGRPQSDRQLVERASASPTDPAPSGPGTGRPASSWSKPWRPWPSRFCSSPSRSPSWPPARRHPACSPS